MEYFYPNEHEVSRADKNCHEKACHCISDFWLFGGAQKRGYKNERDLDFGKKYRNMYGMFVRTGQLTELSSWSRETLEFNHLTELDIQLETMFFDDCNLFDDIDRYLLF